MSDEEHFELKLGERVYSDLNVSKSGFDMYANHNYVYLNTRVNDNTDILQFPYDPNKRRVFIGKVRSELDSAVGEGQIDDYNVYVNVVTQDTSGGTEEGGGSSGGDSSGGVDFSKTPEYKQVVQLLDYIDFNYGEQRDIEVYNTSTASDNRVCVGFRFAWKDDEAKTFNCVRWKNFSTGATSFTLNEAGDNWSLNTSAQRYTGDIFLKVVEYDINDLASMCAGVGDSVTNVSVNTVNQSTDNVQNNYYSWYFAEPITFKPNKVYVFFPHHDRSGGKVTGSQATMVVSGTTNIMTAYQGLNGMWWGNPLQRRAIFNSNTSTTPAQNRQNENFEPIIEFCNADLESISIKVEDVNSPAIPTPLNIYES